MRVLQVIDSLEAGGAERMAVNYANALQDQVDQSFLCCTRKEGLLTEKIGENVEYCFLNKTSTLDGKAFRKLKNYISDHKIDIVHAHSTSYFLITMIKIFGRKKFKLVWHDHYGNSDFLEKRPRILLKLLSVYFDGIICVNVKLGNWSKKNLKCPKVEVFRNFLLSQDTRQFQPLHLKGEFRDFKFICVANLRPQKDHINLIKAFESLNMENVSLHLVGKNFKDSYSQKVLGQIQKSVKSEKIFYYGGQENIENILNQADAGILSSKSEGLPLALLEYGFAGLPVICTDVGECSAVIKNHGILVPPSDMESLRKALAIAVEDPKFKNSAKAFQYKVLAEYSERAVIPKVLNFYKSI